jgi:hypothetical protein
MGSADLQESAARGVKFSYSVTLQNFTISRLQIISAKLRNAYNDSVRSHD